MPSHSEDTICAVATATGRGGIGIVRISGELVPSLCVDLIGRTLSPRQAELCRFLDQDSKAIDQGIAIYFPTPHSFTGEHVLELHGHGGIQVLDMLLERITGLGVRIANPGEFSERAFLNNKIDLVQAESIADLIDAGSRQAARSAMRTLQGEFSREVEALLKLLVSIRTHVEAAIDFVDEDIDVLSRNDVADSLHRCRQTIDSIFSRAQQGAILNEGMSVVLAGYPNAGKSSLLNALSGMESAIVTPIPGTTRDLLREQILIDGMPVHITDTAGIRDTADEVEKESVKRARIALQDADRILLIADSNEPAQIGNDILRIIFGYESDTASLKSIADRTTLVFNKIDLLGEASSLSQRTVRGYTLPLLQLSAKTGSGLDLLRIHLKDCMGFQSSGADSFVARKRHLLALTSTKLSLDSAIQGVSENSHLELIAEDLRVAQTALGSITGQFTADDLLGEIFASFCIGK